MQPSGGGGYDARPEDEEDEEEGMQNPDVAYDLDGGILHARSVESFIDFFQTLSTLKGLGWDNFAPMPAPASDPAPLKPSDRTKAEKILQRKPDLLTAFQSEAGYARRDDIYRQILQMEKSTAQRPRYSLNDIRRANTAKPDSCARLWLN